MRIFIAFFLLLAFGCQQIEYDTCESYEGIESNFVFEPNLLTFKEHSDTNLVNIFIIQLDTQDRPNFGIDLFNIPQQTGRYDLISKQFGINDNKQTSFFVAYDLSFEVSHEKYVIADFDNIEDVVEIKSITDSKIFGSFNASFVLSDQSLQYETKIYEEIPDTLIVSIDCFEVSKIN